jgi:hypothetical protein
VKRCRVEPVAAGVHVAPPSVVPRTTPSLPAIHTVCASTQATERSGRRVPASWRSQVAPPSRVWKTRPSSPTIQPSRAFAKQAPKRFCRISRAETGVASAAAARLPGTRSMSATAHATTWRRKVAKKHEV